MVNPFLEGLLSTVESLSRTVADMKDQFDTLLPKLGYINEETIRRRLADAKGSSWARSLRVCSLSEAIDWIGTGLRKTPAERLEGMENVIDFVLEGFVGFTRWSDEAISWEDVTPLLELF
jgi:hypothetical protein